MFCCDSALSYGNIISNWVLPTPQMASRSNKSITSRATQQNASRTRMIQQQYSTHLHQSSCLSMFSGILFRGTWPGPSFITCTKEAHTQHARCYFQICPLYTTYIMSVGVEIQQCTTDFQAQTQICLLCTPPEVCHAQSPHANKYTKPGSLCTGQTL